ncbi:unnamed protein product [Kuraishia capsulata CBS 1993]|uniref:ML-like domain-containing protein n=1 Tax=Kuraishia capsulata CBS 1993 TaxID=1382522 RepID=W6MG11_9ASCO|nr:uncharacterized protein KUCA_T00000881001 [Kuraishia capsulata CBS 1993]CDK24914.1 unnamed protein product [Kuraishia capsulata CBS 1993]
MFSGNLMKFWLAFLALISCARAEKYIKASSLLTCMENSQFSASRFEAKYTPANHSITFDISGISTISDKVKAEVELIVYGITILTETINLCSLNYKTICPLTSGHIDVDSSYQISSSIVDQIPGIGFTVPDLDATVKVMVYSTTNNSQPLACIEAVLSNGRSVQTKYASWPIAAVSGFGLIISSFVSIMGHSSTAAHIASNAVSLFIYFQSLALISMMAVARVPPIAMSWAQNFQWTMGIIETGFMQNIFFWFVQATGGTSTSTIANKSALSISVQKLLRFSHLFKRDEDVESDTSLYTTNESDSDVGDKILVLRGIQRVAYLANIEISNLFLTGITFFLIIALFLLVILSFFKAFVELLIRTNAIPANKFHGYRKDWTTVIKGTLYRLYLIAFPQLVLLCLWECTRHDSAACVVVAIVIFVVAVLLLFQAAIRLLLIGWKSTKYYNNPAYLLFGDAKLLNRFGFLYVQYRADKYWWLSVSLCYALIKSLIVAVLQTQGKAQAVIIFVLELFYFISLCVFRPFMDKRTNVFNILIGLINLLNSVFYLFYSNIFKQPSAVSSIAAVVYFVLNAVFALVLLIFTIVTCVLALVRKNPDTRYQPMRDDRVSFLPHNDSEKKEPDFELAALGATAMRGHDRDSMLVDQAALGSSEDSSTHQLFAERQVSDVSSVAARPVEPSSAVLGDSYSRQAAPFEDSTTYDYNRGYGKDVRWI